MHWYIRRASVRGHLLCSLCSQRVSLTVATPLVAVSDPGQQVVHHFLVLQQDGHFPADVIQVPSFLSDIMQYNTGADYEVENFLHD